MLSAMTPGSRPHRAFAWRLSSVLGVIAVWTVLGLLSAGGTAVIELRVAAGELFKPMIEQISGDVAVRVVQVAAPTIRDAAVTETARQLSRPRM